MKPPLSLFLPLVALASLAGAACGGESARRAAPPAVEVDITPASTPTSAGIAASAQPRPPPAAPSALSLEPVDTPPDPAFCGGKCPGTPNNALIEAISKRAKKARRCYESELATTSSLEGRVIVKMRIGSDGRVCTAKGASDPKMMTVATCVAGYFRAAVGDQSLPAPTGGCADLDLPIMFVPKGDAGAP